MIYTQNQHLGLPQQLKRKSKLKHKGKHHFDCTHSDTDHTVYQRHKHELKMLIHQADIKSSLKTTPQVAAEM